MIIRTASENDLCALTEIYNHEVLNGTATFDVCPKTAEERRAWFFEHNKDNHPLIVAESGGKVAGYGSLSSYNDKEAYSSTVELSVYVAQDARGKGVGTALVSELIKQARADARTHLIVSLITAENASSIRLHERFGFAYCGTLHEVGRKFGRLLDTALYELRVDD